MSWFWLFPKDIQELTLLNFHPCELGRLCVLSTEFNEKLIGEYFDQLWRKLLYKHYFYTGYMRVWGPKIYKKSKSQYIYVGFRKWFERIYIIPNISNTAIIIRRVDWEILKLSGNINGIQKAEKSNEYTVKSTISNIHKAEDHYDMVWLTNSYILTRKIIFAIIPGFDFVRFDSSTTHIFSRNYNVENYEIEIVWSHSHIFGVEIRKCSPAEYYFGFTTFGKIAEIVQLISKDDITSAVKFIKMLSSVKTDLSMLYCGVTPKSQIARMAFMSMISSKYLKDKLQML